MALLTLVVPAWAECRPLAAATAGMSCCMKVAAQQGALESGCCAIRKAPESQQVPATTTAGVRTPSVSTDAVPDVVAPSVNVNRALHAIFAESGAVGPPLFLRLSVIRR